MLEMLRQYADKFLERVAKCGDDECWLWETALDRYGYGRFQFRHLKKKYDLKAHRVSYMLTHGCSLTEADKVCHTCDNRACSNPAHLVSADNDWNMADCVSKGRSARGSKHPNARLTETQVGEIRRRVAAGEQKSALAREFGVVKSTITYTLGNGWKPGWRHINDG